MLMAVGMIQSAEKWGIPEDGDVAVLTDENFDSFVKKHEWVFVKFYAPWCGHCKTMAPMYSELALEQKFAADGIPIAKLDGTIHKEKGKMASGYPTLKLFNRGFAIDFKGEREKKDILAFIQEKKNLKVEKINTLDEYEEIKNAKLAVVYFLESNNNEDFEQFRRFVLQYNKDIPMVITHNKEIQQAMGGKGAASMIVIRNFDDGHKLFNKDRPFKDEELQEHFKNERFAVVMEHSPESADKAYEDKKPTVYLFTDNPQDEALKLLRQIAPQYAKDFSFIYADANNSKLSRLLEFFGIKTNGHLRVSVTKGNKAAKYKINEINEANIVQLLEDIKANKARQYIKTDPIPSSNDQPVKTVVGASFNDEVIKKNKHVLIEIYTPWCGHCKRLEPIYHELAIQLSQYDDLVIAKMDGQSNEHPKVETKGYPTILFFAKGRKDKPVKYEGPHEIQKFVVFLNKEIGRVHKLSTSSEL